MAGLPLLLLGRADVSACLDFVDPVRVVESVLRLHAACRTVLPAEGYLGWKNTEDADCRSLAMLGSVRPGAASGADPLLGIKVINAAVSNPDRGLERASGLGILFDPLTARPVLLAEAGLISAIRTAAYTALCVRHLGPSTWTCLGLLGAGMLARAHLDVLAAENPGLHYVSVHDLHAGRAARFADWARQRHPSLQVEVQGGPGAVAREADVLVTLTTSARPYLRPTQLKAGSFVAHVSLDDLDPDCFAEAEALYVDDVDLVRDNPRRILGALMAAGRVTPPGAGCPPPARALTGTLGEVLLGHLPATRPTSGFVVSNPFGMSVLDIGLLDAVHEQASRQGRGVILDFLSETCLSEGNET